MPFFILIRILANWLGLMALGIAQALMILVANTC